MDDLLKVLKENTPRGDKPIGEVRTEFQKFYLQYQSSENITCESIIINNIPCFWVSTPGCGKERVILFFHGGGYTIGSTKDHIGLCGRLSQASNARVLSVDYRLAPENTFPAAIDDCFSVYNWMLSSGFSAEQIIPVGISSGGTLVLSLLISLRDKGMPLPQKAVCMSPVVDLLFPGKSLVTNKDNDWITGERLHSITKLYMPGMDPTQPLASPAYADLSGLPPLLVQAGSHELMLDDISKFIDKALAEGVKVDFEIWEGMIHCWQIFASVIPDGVKAIGNIGRFIEKKNGDITG